MQAYDDGYPKDEDDDPIKDAATVEYLDWMREGSASGSYAGGNLDGRSKLASAVHRVGILGILLDPRMAEKRPGGRFGNLVPARRALLRLAISDIRANMDRAIAYAEGYPVDPPTRRRPGELSRVVALADTPPGQIEWRALGVRSVSSTLGRLAAVCGSRDDFGEREAEELIRLLVFDRRAYTAILDDFKPPLAAWVGMEPQ